MTKDKKTTEKKKMKENISSNKTGKRKNNNIFTSSVSKKETKNRNNLKSRKSENKKQVAVDINKTRKDRRKNEGREQNFDFWSLIQKEVIFSKSILIYTVIVSLIGIISIAKSLAALVPINNVEIFSEGADYNSHDAGAWRVDKSAKWVDKGIAEVTFDINSIPKEKTEYKDVLFVLDISGSMSGDKLDKVKSDTTELITDLLSNGTNRAGVITFSDTSQIIKNFTNNKEEVTEAVNKLYTNNMTNYYQALVNVDTVLKNYKKEENRECIVLFLTDGYPNVDIPNEEGQYEYLKNKYQYLTIHGIQYEMGDKILSPIEKVSDKQFIADMNSLNNILYEASMIPLAYDSFKISDYINTEYFILENASNIKVSSGKTIFDYETQKVTWNINNLKSSYKASMKIKLKLKDEHAGTGGVFFTNEKEIIKSAIDGQEENVSSNLTPSLKADYKVLRDFNLPAGCSIDESLKSESYDVFEKVEINKVVPQCAGYKFKGWKFLDKDVRRLNNEYFKMPEKNVELRAEWSSMKVDKIMDGKVYVAAKPIIQRRDYNYNEKLWKYKDSITKIVFETEIKEPLNATESWDISESNTGTVMAYVVPNDETKSTYTAYIQGDEEIIANKDSSYLFYNFRNLTQIVGIEKLNTSNVQSLNSLFYVCQSLQSLDLSSWDVSNVSDMAFMFGFCEALSSLNISGWNTANVVNMNGTFSHLAVTSFDVSSLNTSKVTNMSMMFYDCTKLKTLNLTNFDTSNVTTMNEMFKYSKALTIIKVSSFNTSKVTDMAGMFSGCESLTGINLTNFDTANVTDMNHMFAWCESLTSLNVSNFNTAKVTNMDSMFYYLKKVTSLDITNFRTSNVTDMSSMFAYCDVLSSLKVSNAGFSTKKVTDTYNMFYNCSRLTAEIIISGAGITSYNSMFSGAATASGAKITVGYTNDTSNLVTKMLATKSSNSNVVKGNLWYV